MVGSTLVISFWPRLLRSQYHWLYSRFALPDSPHTATVICATAPARAKPGDPAQGAAAYLEIAVQRNIPQEAGPKTLDAV